MNKRLLVIAVIAGFIASDFSYSAFSALLKTGEVIGNINDLFRWFSVATIATAACAGLAGRQFFRCQVRDILISIGIVIGLYTGYFLVLIVAPLPTARFWISALVTLIAVLTPSLIKKQAALRTSIIFFFLGPVFFAISWCQYFLSKIL